MVKACSSPAYKTEPRRAPRTRCLSHRAAPEFRRGAMSAASTEFLSILATTAAPPLQSLL
jgi:hypothetical protein